MILIYVAFHKGEWKMKAAVLQSGKKILDIKEVPVPQLRPGQVKIKIKACGICGSDVHLVIHGTLKCKHFPRIPGHESSGVIEEVGENVSRFQKGDRVVISAGTSCGVCSYCKAGYDNLCKDVGVFGFDRDGGFAEYNIVEERYLYSLPDTIPFDQGAILADAVSTPYHAIRYRGNIQNGDTVAIFGCGGLGIHAVAVARAMTDGKVIALDVERGPLENAAKYGADEIINLKEIRNPGKTLKEVTNGVDLLADFSGYMSNIEESLRAMNPGGRIVLVGIGRQPLKFQIPFILIERMISVLGSYGSDRRAIPELIDLYLKGKINLSHSITSHHTLEELNQCLEDLDERKGNPIRFIIQP
ncbi:putative chlorophyll synthesis pathway protein BchC [Leptospira weilii str. 2006001853]|uniref:Putative chlorophyll synthesis pathway protein BchC n=3 Tax=Leptospiraceae TaxID=170 RepID=A0A828Z372_9LEPT|nr:putative chlorophyll synthesis pathway protein BchC [Leptospira weilii str. 2006001853]EMJ62804.1 putative chlorophyll synthesis pathway protein BchC [Leptospira sp. P2653]EMM73040.1 putative chlorophyll synthesis pathway protein BchC [Leptospira weilii str. 2006001855]EMN42896.1 putative chlorophyll synthesis pathway protein BchC [Leptospira weilii str. LNT 1234]